MIHVVLDSYLCREWIFDVTPSESLSKDKTALVHDRNSHTGDTAFYTSLLQDGGEILKERTMVSISSSISDITVIRILDCEGRM